jgi:hypothetical protein
MSEPTVSPLQELREAATFLSRIRGRPCLVLNMESIEAGTVRRVRDALGDTADALDVVIRSPGGCACCAYVVARELRRRFERMAAFVPLGAKSAAALIALSADELVLGDLGELGPLDSQASRKQKADFPVERSSLEVFQALGQLKRHALESFDDLVRTVAEKSGMRGEDVCRVGTEFAARVCEPLYAQIDPQALAESAHGLEVGAAYAERVLRRYRPDLDDGSRSRIIERLVRGYPCHGFRIDREELAEIGVPVRGPTAEEAVALERLAELLDGPAGRESFIELLCGDASGAVGDSDGTGEGCLGLAGAAG